MQPVNVGAGPITPFMLLLCMYGRRAEPAKAPTMPLSVCAGCRGQPRPLQCHCLCMCRLPGASHNPYNAIVYVQVAGASQGPYNAIVYVEAAMTSHSRYATIVCMCMLPGQVRPLQCNCLCMWRLP